MTIEAFVDGSANNKDPNGFGGYGICAFVDGVMYTASKGFSGVKSGRMELAAVVEFLESILDRHTKHVNIKVTSDSQYVINSINRYVDKWVRGGDIASMANSDLWIRYLKVIRKFQPGAVEFVWVKGHNGNEGNEIADKLARAAYNKVKELSCGGTNDFSGGISF